MIEIQFWKSIEKEPAEGISVYVYVLYKVSTYYTSICNEDSCLCVFSLFCSLNERLRSFTLSFLPCDNLLISRNTRTRDRTRETSHHQRQCSWVKVLTIYGIWPWLILFWSNFLLVILGRSFYFDIMACCSSRAMSLILGWIDDMEHGPAQLRSII